MSFLIAWSITYVSRLSEEAQPTAATEVFLDLTPLCILIKSVTKEYIYIGLHQKLILVPFGHSLRRRSKDLQLCVGMYKVKLQNQYRQSSTEKLSSGI